MQNSEMGPKSKHLSGVAVQMSVLATFFFLRRSLRRSFLCALLRNAICVCALSDAPTIPEEQFKNVPAVRVKAAGEGSDSLLFFGEN